MSIIIKRVAGSAAGLLALLFCFNLYAGTDLEVTYIERNPKYFSYQGHTRYYSNHTFYDDFTPYSLDVAYGLLGQDETTKRWPDPGETVTWTAHVYNRGNTVINSFDYEWTLDDSSIDSGTFSTMLDPGDFGIVSINWSWEFAEHELKFSTTVSGGDDHPSNNEVMIYTNSLGLFTFIDFGYADDFKDSTAGVANPTTDSIIEWCQLHCTRLNNMFIEAGSDLRWRYDRLDLVDDYPASLPPYDRANWDGNWPTRFKVGDGDFRFGSGYYDATEDIDYGFLHEVGHQLGIIDIYRMDVSASQNEVNAQGYYGAPACLWHGVSHIISQHTALAMSHWHGKRRGYFGQYLFSIPATNKLRVLSIEGIPVPDADITIYQQIETNGIGTRIPNIPKFSGTTNSLGFYDIPNVSLGEKHLFWADTGDVLNDNPFGYISNHGENGVFLIKLKKDGIISYGWLDITSFNIQYWLGNTEEATYDVETSFRMAPYLASGLELAVLDTPYSGQLQVYKGASPHTFTLLRGMMPPGLSLNSNGSITGIPTERGEYPIVVELTDSSTPDPFVSEWDVAVQVIDPGVWQMHQNTKRRIGTSVVAGPTEFSLLWSVPNGSVGVMAPAVSRPAVFYGASWGSNTVWKIDKDGNKIWEADEDVGGHLNGTPALGLEGESSTSVYIGGSYILDINKSTGNVNWNTNPTSGYSDYIAIGNNSTIYTHTWNNTMYGLRDTGMNYSVVFTGVSNQDCRAPAALYGLHDEGEIMTWGGRGGWIYAVKTDDYSYLWTLHMPGSRIDLAPCVDSLNTLYYATNRDNKEFFFAVEGKTGKVSWELATDRDTIWASGSGALSMDQKTYYVQTQGNAVNWSAATTELGYLYAINTSDGTIKWSYNTKNYGWDMAGLSCLVDKDGKIFISANKTMHCIKDMETYGQEIWSQELEATNIVPQSFSTDDRGVLFIGAKIDGISGLHALYTEPEQEPAEVYQMILNSSGNVEIKWLSQVGATYRVETTTDEYVEGAMTWITAEDNIQSGGTATTWIDTNVPVSGHQFYRVITKD